MTQLEHRRLTKGLIMGFKYRELYLEKNGLPNSLGKRRAISVNVKSGKSGLPQQSAAEECPACP